MSSDFVLFRGCIAISMFAFFVTLSGTACHANPMWYGDDDVGCLEEVQTSPYCTDPEIRALVNTQAALFNMASDAEPITFEEDKIIGNSGYSKGSTHDPTTLLFRVIYSQFLSVRRCGNDRDCILSEVEPNVSAMRDIMGVEPGVSLVGEGQVSSIEDRVAERELARSSVDAARTAYERDWLATHELLEADNGGALFEFRHPRPEGWWRLHEPKCERRPEECLADLERDLAEVRAEKSKAEAAIEAQERRERMALLEENARERRKAEAEAARLRDEARKRDLLREKLRDFDIRSVLPRESPFRSLVMYDAAAFDRDVAIPAAERMGDDTARITGFFGYSGLAPLLRDDVIDNRRNSIVASYAVTRMHVLGPCGDDIKDVYMRTTNDIVTTRFGAEVNRIPGRPVYTSVPGKFAAAVSRSGFENEDGAKSWGIFYGDLDFLSGCDDPIRGLIEHNLLAWARDIAPTGKGDPILWDADDIRLLDFLP